jgi:hypothetical protein
MGWGLDDSRAGVKVLRRQPVGPHLGVLDQMIVDGQQLYRWLQGHELTPQCMGRKELEALGQPWVLSSLKPFERKHLSRSPSAARLRDPNGRRAGTHRPRVRPTRRPGSACRLGSAAVWHRELTTVLTTLTTVAVSATPPTRPFAADLAWLLRLPAPGSVGLRGIRVPLDPGLKGAAGPV